MPNSRPRIFAGRYIAVDDITYDLWEVQEWKIWKGISLTVPVWANRNFVSESYTDMQEIADEFERLNGNPHRVVRRKPIVLK